MPIIEHPWRRVRNPTPIPNPAALAHLDNHDFAALVRSHLLPGQGDQAHHAWSELWQTLGNDQLSARTFDVLDDFLETTSGAIASGDLDAANRARANKFIRTCQDARTRLDKPGVSGALNWAGAAGRFGPAGQRVIAQLVEAIASHRLAVTTSGYAPTTADKTLWAALRRVDLDPEDRL